MLKTVKLKDTVSPDLIGCTDHEHFKKYLAGHMLHVLEEEPHAVLIQDLSGLQFNILKSHLSEAPVIAVGLPQNFK